MNWIALKMLTGDRAKYFGIVFGVSFAALLMTQQASIFWGLMTNTTSQIRDLEGAAIWVMDPNIRFVDDIKPLGDEELYRVRGVPGVAWAVRLYKGIARARFADGNFQQMILLGLDDATLVGAPREITLGDLADLRQPDAVIIDEGGFKYLWPDEPFSLGKTFEMNDKRAVIVGICKARPTFQTFPIVYTRYTQAIGFVPRERKTLSFILAEPEDGLDAGEVCRRIEEHTRYSESKLSLRALTRQEFIWLTIEYYLKRTGIPINFGITVALGFVVGAAIAGQTFYLFTIENLKQFGALKAMGVSNLRLMQMSLLQAAVVGVIGYGLGVGGAVCFGLFMTAMAKTVPPAFLMTWQILVMSAIGVFFIMVLASVVSIRKVLVLEPAVVFK
jgi:putative ABC transport system permease protein